MLLLPNKNAHPDLTVLSVAAFLLDFLMKHRIARFLELYERLSKHEPRALSLFEPALETLYVLGLIEYHKKNDLIEYTGK